MINGDLDYERIARLERELLDRPPWEIVLHNDTIWPWDGTEALYVYQDETGGWDLAVEYSGTLVSVPVDRSALSFTGLAIQKLGTQLYLRIVTMGSA